MLGTHAHRCKRDGWAAAQINARLHLTDGLGQADEDGAADDAVADVELFHAVQSRDRRDVLVIEAVAGVEFQSGGDGGDGRGLESVELAVAIGPFGGVGVTPRVQLDCRWRRA